MQNVKTEILSEVLHKSLTINVGMEYFQEDMRNTVKQKHITYTHTHTHTYIYIK